MRKDEVNFPQHISKIMPDVVAEIRRNFAKAQRKVKENEYRNLED